MFQFVVNLFYCAATWLALFVIGLPGTGGWFGWVLLAAAVPQTIGTLAFGHRVHKGEAVEQ